MHKHMGSTDGCDQQNALFMTLMDCAIGFANFNGFIVLMNHSEVKIWQFSCG